MQQETNKTPAKDPKTVKPTAVIDESGKGAKPMLTGGTGKGIIDTNTKKKAAKSKKSKEGNEYSDEEDDGL